MIKKTWVILSFIFLLALILRIYNLGSIPSGFHNDEVDVGYAGKFIVLHGRDPAGNFLPLAFDKFGDFRPIGLFILAGISQLIFSSNEFAVRLPTALFGAMTTLALYLFTKKLWGNDLVAILSAFFLAILPWHIVLSRASHEAIVGYFLILLGFYFLLAFAKGGSRKDLILAIIIIFSSYFFYHAIRLLVPLLMMSSLPFIKNKTITRTSTFFLILTILFLSLPIGKGRFFQVVFYKNPNITQKINELPFADKSSLIQARIFHNKPVVYSRELIANYLQYFSADFLFLRGGYPERYLVPEAGHIYLAFIPLILLGLSLIIKKGGIYYLPLIWLIITPIFAVLTYEDIPSATRTSFMAIPLVMIAGLGASSFLQLRKIPLSKIITIIFLLVLFAETTFFFHQYLVHQKVYKGITRDEGARAITLNDLSSDFQYKNVLFTRDRCPSHRFEKYNDSIIYIQSLSRIVKKDLGRKLLNTYIEKI